MKREIKKAAALLLCSMMAWGMLSLLPQSPVIIEAQAHGCRGGHHNSGSAGGYYYHCGGHPAHLHTDGVCPYAGSSTVTTQTVPAGNTAGWHHDEGHWKYTCTDGTDLSGCWKQIDSDWYCFDKSGCMRTGWYDEEGCRYYLSEDGKMSTGSRVIDGCEYYFDDNGKMQ